MADNPCFSEVSIDRELIDAFIERNELTKKDFTYLLGYPRNVWVRKIAKFNVIAKPPHLVLAIHRVLQLEKLDRDSLLAEIKEAKRYVKIHAYDYD
jgi:hypothetical protein